ncbi:beta-lactamase family protein [Planomonospora sp. ID91781]|uniref:Penicillin-binding protein n=1 Tax=Planomonospora sphaerica TaxID=161355 RepID=A0A171DLA1_9ACTN|nr:MULTISPECIES: serine hydrolase domain-containing protein [Planomonospora]MBG0819185.1 beta-lactamase family protein [Planomonospora sp. ID91781]GAT69631.1 penicillin-binding protein [Planomonospora sphaerica]
MTEKQYWNAEGAWKAEGARGTTDSTGRGFPLSRWQARLDELRAAHRVPGASLAVLVDGEVHELASGVLHRGTGVEATTDSVFLSGSVAKVYTATLIMQLVDSGALDLDAPVVSVLPEFATPDPEATKAITVRRLLSHTGGVTNDFNHDSGRGDDCLAGYVEAARDVALDCPPGTALSYGSLGYVVLGRVVEVLTGKTWDRALKDMLFTPLGLEHSMTLPEEALRFRVAMSHLGGPGADPDPAPAWDLMPRSAGPAGRVIVSAGDLARFARMHLAGGAAPDGTRVLSEEAAAAMQRHEADSPDKWTVSADGWGLGWTLYDWNGVAGFGHDGAAIGQYAYLRVVPGAGVAVALLTNGGSARLLYADLFRELLTELAGVTMPAPFGPPAQPLAVDIAPFLGTYRREGVVITVGRKDDGTPHLRYEFVDGMKDLSPPLEADLIPVSETVFAASGAGPSFSEDHMPVVFSTLADGTACCYVGMRATPKVA